MLLLENPSNHKKRKVRMARKSFVSLAFIIILTFLLAIPTGAVKADSITAGDLINMMNAQRTHHGLAALVEDPILNGVAQGDAEYMLATHLMGDMGGVRQRVLNAGYGDGQNAFATENWAMDFNSIDEIQLAWSDPLHMIPVNNAYYKNVGAGVATDGKDTYYVLVAAYVEGGIANPTQDPKVTRSPTTSQYMQPVTTSTPQADGAIVHIVQSGQSLWSIAIAYGMHIAEIKSLNKWTSDTVYVGQTLIIRLAPTITPTPTITETPPLPSRTPAPTQFLKLPTHTPYPTATSTPTPIVPGLPSLDRRTLGIIIIAVCALGLAVVLLVSSVRKKPDKPEKTDL
jgi:LysM repeat protein